MAKAADWSAWRDYLYPEYATTDKLRLAWLPRGMTPTNKQAAFLSLVDREVFFGGAAGPGKSSGLLMAALQYVDVPGYAALLLRKTYRDLALPGALMDMAHRWLDDSAAQWQAGNVRWVFPSGATLTFGHLQNEKDKLNYQSAEFHFIGFDELTHFTETQYRYLFSRLRRPSEGGGAIAHVPLRMRSASNPGGPGHEWVRSRFIDQDTKEPTSTFMPARLEENPHLDQSGYLKNLRMMNPLDYDRLRKGDWDVHEAGTLFQRHWFRIIDTPPPLTREVRYWDFAATEAVGANDPDWTVGTRMGVTASGEFVISDVKRFRHAPGAVEKIVDQTAAEDGHDVPIWIEEEPGSAGKFMIRQTQQRLRGYIVKGNRVTGDKTTRAAPFASAAEHDLVSIVRGSWIGHWLDEHERFPMTDHDDQVDTSSGAHWALTRASGNLQTSVPRARLPNPRMVGVR